jgi:hypothetical protein
MGLHSWLFGNNSSENEHENEHENETANENEPNHPNLITASSLDEFKHLLQDGVDPNENIGMTNPLNFWVNNNNREYVMLLLMYGANTSQVTTTDTTQDSIRLLLEIAGYQYSTQFSEPIEKMKGELQVCQTYAPTTPHYPAAYSRWIGMNCEAMIRFQLDRARELDHISSHLTECHTLLWICMNQNFQTDIEEN